MCISLESVEYIKTLAKFVHLLWGSHIQVFISNDPTRNSFTDSILSQHWKSVDVYHEKPVP